MSTTQQKLTVTTDRYEEHQQRGHVLAAGREVRAVWPGHRLVRAMDSAAEAERLARGLATVPVNYSVLRRLGFEDAPAGRRAG